MSDQLNSSVLTKGFRESKIQVIKDCYFIEGQMISLFDELLSEPDSEIPEETISLLSHGIYAINFKYTPEQKCEMSPKLYSYLITLYSFQLEYEEDAPGVFDCFIECDEYCKVFKNTAKLLFDIDINNIKYKRKDKQEEEDAYYISIANLFKTLITIFYQLTDYEQTSKLALNSQPITNENIINLNLITTMLEPYGFTKEVLRIIKLFYLFAIQYKLEEHIIFIHTNYIKKLIEKSFDIKDNYINSDKQGPLIALNYFHKYTARRLYNFEKFQNLGMPDISFKLLLKVNYSEEFLRDFLDYLNVYLLTEQTFDNLQYETVEELLKKTKDFRICLFLLQQLKRKYNSCLEKQITFNALNANFINTILCIFADMEMLSSVEVVSSDLSLFKYFADYNNKFYLKPSSGISGIITMLNSNYKLVNYQKYPPDTEGIDKLIENKIVLPFLGRCVIIKSPSMMETLPTEATFIHEKTKEEKVYNLYAIIVESKIALIKTHTVYVHLNDKEWVKMNNKVNLIDENNSTKLQGTIEEELNKCKSSVKLTLFYKEKRYYAIYSLINPSFLFKNISNVYNVSDLSDIIDCMKYDLQLTKENLEYIIDYFLNKGKNDDEMFIKFLEEYLPEIKDVYLEKKKEK